MGERPRVIIVGAGFGGIGAARILRRADVDVTLVDANNYHLFQPLLYQVAIAGLDADDIAYPVRAIIRRPLKRVRSRGKHVQNVMFRLGRVDELDVYERTVTLHDGAILRYDYLVLSINGDQ